MIKYCKDCGKGICIKAVRCKSCARKFQGNIITKKGRERLSERMKQHNPQKGKFRENHSKWKGGRWIDKQGYIMRYKPNHPFSRKNGYIGEHRLIMEDYLGRYLEPNEIPHHLNEDPGDNRIENLKLKTLPIHSKEHGIEFAKNRIRDDGGKFI